MPISQVKMNYLFDCNKIIGDNFKNEKFLSDFRATGHPDAMWFFELFPNGVNGNDSDVKNLFLSQPDDGGRSLYFASHFAPFEIAVLWRSIKMGYVLSYGELATTRGDHKGDISFPSFLTEGAKKESSKCCEFLAQGLDNGSDDKYIEKGARLGNDACMDMFRRRLNFNDRIRWILSWLYVMKYELWDYWYNCVRNVSDVSTLFYIGELSSRGDHKHRKMSQTGFNGKERVFAYYGRVVGAVRDECVTWSLIGRSCRLHKDVRILISKMVWLSRFEGREFE